MGEGLSVHVTNADQLADVDALLHDAAFSMADLMFDSQLGTVEISFYANPHMHDFYFRRPFRRRSVTTEPPEDRLLTISHVANISVEDPDGLVEHSYARLSSPETGRITLMSNFPGRIDFEVTAIDVRLTA
jgi:hypothetical protein